MSRPGRSHPVKAVMIYFAIGIACLWAISWAILPLVFVFDELEIVSRTQMPVSEVGALEPGPSVKVFGVIESSVSLPLEHTGVKAVDHFRVRPFNVTDATGRIAVDVATLEDSSSHFHVFHGPHDDSYWAGDRIAVVGEVYETPAGERRLKAEYAAPGPDGFHVGGLATVFLMAGVPWGFILAMIAFESWRRRNHRTRSADFRRGLSSLPCSHCGAPLGRSKKECPECRRPVPWWVSLDLVTRPRRMSRLRQLEFRTSFRLILAKSVARPSPRFWASRCLDS